jgi:hypothetical protein
MKGKAIVMTKVKFFTKLTKSGRDNLIIWIPSEFLPDMKELRQRKQVRVTIDDEF